MDRAENPTSNIYSIVACVRCSGIVACLRSCCLPIAVFSESFPSNGFSLLVSKFWLSADMSQYYLGLSFPRNLLYYLPIKIVQNLSSPMCATSSSHLILLYLNTLTFLCEAENYEPPHYVIPFSLLLAYFIFLTSKYFPQHLPPPNIVCLCSSHAAKDNISHIKHVKLCSF
jgi:hypothetical protein